MMSNEITRPDLEKQNRKFVRKKISKSGISWLVVLYAKSKKNDLRKQNNRYTTFNLTLKNFQEIFFPAKL